MAKKYKVYKPKYKNGGDTDPPSTQGRTGMMKARMAYEYLHGNPSARRMMNSAKAYYWTGDEYDALWQQPVGVEAGNVGSQYMGTFGNYAIPFIQEDSEGKLIFNEAPSKTDTEAWKFDTPEDAAYFAEHYKEIAPSERTEFADGGTVSELWESVTGTPWSEAKARGLTTGSYEDNIALLRKLRQGEIPRLTPTPQPSVEDIIDPMTPTHEIPLRPEVNESNLDITIDNASNFNEAFKIARERLGANQIFIYNGRRYGTNRSGEAFNPTTKTLEKAGLSATKTKKRIEEENKKVESPFTSKDVVKVESDIWNSWEDVKNRNDDLNKEDNAETIINFHKNLKKGDNNFVIVDKKKGLMHMYKPDGSLLFSEAFNVDTAKNPGDAQTVTKYRDKNGNGIIDPEEVNKYNVDWSAGNKSTGAGKFFISNIDQSGYGGLPLLNMMNERQFEQYKEVGQGSLKSGETGVNITTKKAQEKLIEAGYDIKPDGSFGPNTKKAIVSYNNKLRKEGKKSGFITLHPENISTSFHKGYVADDKTRVSNGCIRCSKPTLNQLSKNLGVTSEVYILPDDADNKFVIENGKLNFKVGNKKDYDNYVDERGDNQKGQGINRSTNTLNYLPIKTFINKTTLKNQANSSKGGWSGGWSEDQYTKGIKPFAASLAKNKAKIMKAAKINGDVYNEIAKMSFGIFGTETNYGDQHDPLSNYARAINKFITKGESSSPDYKTKYTLFSPLQKAVTEQLEGEGVNFLGVNLKVKPGTFDRVETEEQSHGLTQIRFAQLDETERKALKEVGITEVKQLLDPKSAAIATATILGVRYNTQLHTDEDKKNMWETLPTKWNLRENYSDRVKHNAEHFTIEQISEEFAEEYKSKLKEEEEKPKPEPINPEYRNIPGFQEAIQKAGVGDIRKEEKVKIVDHAAPLPRGGKQLKQMSLTDYLKPKSEDGGTIYEDGGTVKKYKVFKPSYENGGEPGKVLTWKNDKDYIQGIADWGIASDVPVTTRQSENIKRRLRTGKWGYNPSTGALIPLKGEQIGTISPEDKPFVDEVIASTLRTSEEQEALTKAISDKALATQRSLNPNRVVIDQFTAGFKGGKPGDVLYLSDSELDDYTKNWITSSDKALQEGFIWNLPGTIATAGTGVLGAAGAVAGSGAGLSQIYQGNTGVGSLMLGASLLPYAGKGISRAFRPHIGIRETGKNVLKTKPKVISKPKIEDPLEPYLGKRITPPTREQEILESFYSHEKVKANKAARTTHYDKQGNIVEKGLTKVRQHFKENLINRDPNIKNMGFSLPFGKIAAKADDPLFKGPMYSKSSKPWQGRFTIGERELKQTAKELKSGDINFKSEIDWGKWHKEIPANKALMEEYKIIEAANKEYGTWMKNPDGSKFLGEPEQFIQQQSKNFKKFYDESLVKGESGYPLTMYHGSPKKDITSFLKPGDKGYKKAPTTTTGESGIYFSDKKEYADLYQDLAGPGQGAGKTYAVYLSPKTAITAGEGAMSEIGPSFLWHHGKVPTDAVVAGKFTQRVNPKAGFEVSMENPNLIKSIRNRGTFDINNPDIYKSLVPIVGVSGLTGATLVEYEHGGTIKNMGYQGDFLR